MRSTFAGLGTLAAAAIAAGAAAQTYPSGTVKIVVASAPGTQSDIVSRAIAQRLAPALGQPVVIDNRPGADGMLSVEAVVAAPADGLTLVNVQSGSLTIAPTLYGARMRYDPERDLAAITHTVRATFILTTDAARNIRDIKDFVAFTKANPKTAAIGHTTGAAYLAALLVRQVSQADVELITYKGQPQIWTDMFGGRIHAGIEPVGGSYAQIKAGKIRPLALLGAQRTSLLPDLPTAAEQGFAGIEADAWNGIFARAGTPQPVIDRLHREITKILGEIKDGLHEQGMEVWISDPAALMQRVRDDRAKWAKVIKDYNVRAD